MVAHTHISIKMSKFLMNYVRFSWSIYTDTHTYIHLAGVCGFILTTTNVYRKKTNRPKSHSFIYLDCCFHFAYGMGLQLSRKTGFTALCAQRRVNTNSVNYMATLKDLSSQLYCVAKKINAQMLKRDEKWNIQICRCGDNFKCSDNQFSAAQASSRGKNLVCLTQ